MPTHGELWREVPAGPVQKQNGVHARSELLREGGEEHGHGLGGRTRQGQGKGLVGARPAGGKQIHPVVALVGDPWRSDTVLVPAMTEPAFLPDPGLVLTPKLDLGLRMRRGDGGELRAKLLF